RPVLRLEVRRSIQLSYRRIRYLRARPGAILPLVPSLCPGTLPAQTSSSRLGSPAPGLGDRSTLYTVASSRRLDQGHSYIDERQRRTMRKIVVVVFASLVIASGAAYSVAQTAGVSVSTVELRDVAVGWSAKKQ